MECFDCGGTANAKGKFVGNSDEFYLCSDCYLERYKTKHWLPERIMKEEQKDCTTAVFVAVLVFLIFAIIIALGFNLFTLPMR